MLTLYYVRRTRSSRPRWLLEELGLPYQLLRLDPRQKPEGYERLHPLGHVPVLQDGDFALFESAAICLYLADRAGRLAPAAGTAERAHYYQWICFVVTEVEPLVTFLSGPLRRPLAEQAGAEVDQASAEMVKARADLGRGLTALAAGLGDKETLLPEFSAADVLAGSVLIWANSLGQLAAHPTLLAYVQRLKVRPAYLRATAD